MRAAPSHGWNCMAPICTATVCPAKPAGRAAGRPETSLTRWISDGARQGAAAPQQLRTHWTARAAYGAWAAFHRHVSAVDAGNRPTVFGAGIQSPADAVGLPDRLRGWADRLWSPVGQIRPPACAARRLDGVSRGDARLFAGILDEQFDRGPLFPGARRLRRHRAGPRHYPRSLRRRTRRPG